MLPITEYPSFVREAKGYLESSLDNWRQVENAMRYLAGLVVPHLAESKFPVELYRRRIIGTDG